MQNLFKVVCVMEPYSYTTKDGATAYSRDLILEDAASMFPDKFIITVFNKEADYSIKEGDIVLAGLSFFVSNHHGRACQCVMPTKIIKVTNY